MVRSLARETGSASLPARAGYLSTSSKNTYRQGRDARFAGEPASTAERVIPRNRSSVRLDLGSYFSARLGQERIIDLIRVSAKTSRKSSLGMTDRAGPGSSSTREPIMLSTASVPPVWAALTTTISSTSGSVKASIISCR